MSDNWNKKQLNKRLNSIFTGLEENSEIPGLSIFNNLSGWIWEVNTQGIITKCSPDIQSFLGYDPENIMHQPLSAISDFDLHQAALPTHYDSNIVPTLLELTFYHVKGTKTTSTVYVLPRFDANKTFRGWRGVTVLTPSIPDINLPKQALSASAAPNPPLSDIISQDEIAAPAPNLEVSKPENITDISPEAKEALDMLEENDQQEEGILIEEPFAIPQPQPTDEVKHFLRSIDSNPERVWEPEEIQLVEQVHSQLELAMENARLFQQTQEALAETDEQARRLRLLNEMSENLAQAQNLAEVYTVAVETTAKIFHANHTSIALLTEDGSHLETFYTTGDIEDPAPGTKSPVPSILLDLASADKRAAFTPDLDNPNAPEGVKSAMIGPIAVAGELVGTLNIASLQPDAFDDQDETFLTQVLTLLNAVIENRSLFSEIENALTQTEEQARKLAELNLLSEQISQAETFQDVINITMRQIDAIIPCKICLTGIPAPDNGHYIVYRLADNAGEIVTGSLQAENTLLSKVAEEKLIYANSEIDSSPYLDAQQMAIDHNIRSVLAAPLTTGDETIGTIMIGTDQEFAYTAQDETLIQSIGSIVAATIENRTLFQQIQRRSLQLETSAEVSRIATTILDPAELLPEVVELIKNGFNLYYAGIFLIDQSGDWTGEPNRWAVLRAGSGNPGRQMIANNHKLEIGGDSMIGTAVANAEARIALDVGEAPSFFKNPYLPDTRSEMALPLLSRGQVLGALSIQSEREAAFSQEDITSLQTLADQLANAIENARLFEQTEIRAEELAVLNEMARSFTQSMDVNHLIEITYQFAGRLMDSENFYLALFDSEQQTIHFKIFIEDGRKIPPPEPKLLLGEGLTDWIIKNKLPVLMPNNVADHLESMGIENRGRMSLSWLGVPMLLENKILGVIAVQSYQHANAYTNHELDLLSAVANQAAVAIDNAMRFQQSQARARFEQILREITTRVHSSTNAESILRTAVREVSNALGKRAFIELNPLLGEVSNGQAHSDVRTEAQIPPLPPSADEQAEEGER